MKKKILYVLLIGTIVLNVSACGNKKEEKSLDGSFSITCTGKNPKENGIVQEANVVYNFGKDQYLTSYELTTVSKFDDFKTYKYYKKSSEETAKNNSESSITYNVKGNDKKKELTFGYKVTINREDLDAEENKTYYKAINVLKRSEDSKQSSYSKCTVKGIKRNKLR